MAGKLLAEYIHTGQMPLVLGEAGPGAVCGGGGLGPYARHLGALSRLLSPEVASSHSWVRGWQ